MTDLFGNPDPPARAGEASSPRGGSLSSADHANLPLAVRMRPVTLDEIVASSTCSARARRCGGWPKGGR